MPRKVTNRKPRAAERPLPLMAFSIREFCQTPGFSVDHYFGLQRLGLGPRVMRVGGRVLISHEAAAEWRRARERAPSA
jgi:hypothetical protein